MRAVAGTQPAADSLLQLQRDSDLSRALRTTSRVFLETPAHEPIDSAGHVPGDQRERFRLASHDGREGLRRRLAVERAEA